MKIKLKNITCCSKTELIVWKVRKEIDTFVVLKNE